MYIIYIYIYLIYTYMHGETPIDTYIYIYRKRERDRERERDIRAPRARFVLGHFQPLSVGAWLAIVGRIFENDACVEVNRNPSKSSAYCCCLHLASRLLDASVVPAGSNMSSVVYTGSHPQQNLVDEKSKGPHSCPLSRV